MDEIQLKRLHKWLFLFVKTDAFAYNHGQIAYGAVSNVCFRFHNTSTSRLDWPINAALKIVIPAVYARQHTASLSCYFAAPEVAALPERSGCC